MGSEMKSVLESLFLENGGGELCGKKRIITGGLGLGGWGWGWGLL